MNGLYSTEQKGRPLGSTTLVMAVLAVILMASMTFRDVRTVWDIRYVWAGRVVRDVTAVMAVKIVRYVRPIRVVWYVRFQGPWTD